MKRWIAALLCAMTLLLLLPVFASADYSTTSNRGVELETPEAGEFLETPFSCKLFRHNYIEALYIMPKPEPGHGHLGAVTLGTRVFVLAERNGFFYYVTSKGESGWAWNEWFDYDKDAVSMARADADAECPLYPSVSSRGAELTFPEEDALLEQAESATVRTATSCGSIYLMPMPEKGHGNLGTVGCGEEVEILAREDGFVFFKTADGRYGWNGEDWFE